MHHFLVIPHYNGLANIKNILSKVVKEDFSKIYLIDDASTDRTIDIIKRFDDSRITLIEKKSNKGLTHNLNYGLSIAKGIYIVQITTEYSTLNKRVVF